MTIASFYGDYRFLSNFWLVDVVMDGEVYKSVEHAYMAAKTLDPSIREIIRSISKPGDVKRYCKTIELRHDWEEVKLGVMEDLVRQKFQNPTLKRLLLATGSKELVEGNNWGDTFWGVCRGVGENNLGKILMKVRSELRSH